VILRGIGQHDFQYSTASGIPQNSTTGQHACIGVALCIVTTCAETAVCLASPFELRRNPFQSAPLIRFVIIAVAADSPTARLQRRNSSLKVSRHFVHFISFYKKLTSHIVRYRKRRIAPVPPFWQQCRYDV
jgi:hypothetical protein